MRARGLTQTNHSTAQLATTGLTDNSIDALWEYRYRVRTWAVAGTISVDYGDPGGTTYNLTFSGNLYNSQDPDEPAILGDGEPVLTVQTGSRWDVDVTQPWIFGGDTPAGANGATTMTIGDIAILRPEYAVVGPSTRAQCSIAWDFHVHWDILEDVIRFGNVSTDSAFGTLTATLDGRTLTGQVDDIGGMASMEVEVTITPAAWWPYSDGTTPIWNAATGAQLAPSFQLPM